MVVVTVKVNGIPFIGYFAKRDIKQGEELFISYGKSYWQNLKENKAKERAECHITKIIPGKFKEILNIDLGQVELVERDEIDIDPAAKRRQEDESSLKVGNKVSNDSAKKIVWIDLTAENDLLGESSTDVSEDDMAFFEKFLGKYKKVEIFENAKLYGQLKERFPVYFEKPHHSELKEQHIFETDEQMANVLCGIERCYGLSEIKSKELLKAYDILPTEDNGHCLYDAIYKGLTDEQKVKVQVETGKEGYEGLIDYLKLKAVNYEEDIEINKEDNSFSYSGLEEYKAKISDQKSWGRHNIEGVILAQELGFNLVLLGGYDYVETLGFVERESEIIFQKPDEQAECHTVYIHNTRNHYSAAKKREGQPCIQKSKREISPNYLNEDFLDEDYPGKLRGIIQKSKREISPNLNEKFFNEGFPGELPGIGSDFVSEDRLSKKKQNNKKVPSIKEKSLNFLSNETLHDAITFFEEFSGMYQKVDILKKVEVFAELKKCFPNYFEKPDHSQLKEQHIFETDEQMANVLCGIERCYGLSEVKSEELLKDYDILPAEDNGHCLYHALYQGLTDEQKANVKEETFKDGYEGLIEYLIIKADKYKGNIEKNREDISFSYIDLDDYKAKIPEQTSWGRHNIEGVILAQELGFNLVLLGGYDYVETLGFVERESEIIFQKPDEQAECHTVYIHNTRNHYSAAKKREGQPSIQKSKREISPNLNEKIFNEGFPGELRGIGSDFVSEGRLSKEKQNKQEVVGGVKGFTEIPNDVEGLKSVYFALAACIYYLPEEEKCRIENMLGIFSRNLVKKLFLPLDLDSDVKIYQKVLGEALYKFLVSIDGKILFSDPTNKFVNNGLKEDAKFEELRGRLVDGNIAVTDENLTKAVQARELSIIVQYFGLGLAINHEEEDSRFEHQVRLKYDGGHFTALVKELDIFQFNESRV